MFLVHHFHQDGYQFCMSLHSTREAAEAAVDELMRRFDVKESMEPNPTRDARTPPQVVLDKMKNGEALCRLHARCWQLSGEAYVHHKVAEQVLASPNVVCVGDAVLTGVPCTTWRLHD
jgi:hypothetical protein